MRIIVTHFNTEMSSDMDTLSFFVIFIIYAVNCFTCQSELIV